MQQQNYRQGIVRDQSPSPLHFGAFLKMLRDRHGVHQSRVVAKLPPPWTQPAYSDIERGRTAPAFDQLHIIYDALSQAGVQFSVQDRRQFLALAQHRLKSKRTHRALQSEADWEELRLKLAQVDHLPDSSTSANRQLSFGPRITETRHLVGREAWLGSVTTHLQGSLAKKLLILQGPAGIGKSSELHRLAKHVLQSPTRSIVVLCELPSVERDIGPEIALDMFLSEVLIEVGPPDAALPQASLKTKAALVLGCLQRVARPVLLLLDNAEHLINGEGELAECWGQFLKQFLQWQHQTLLVLATREWHGWLEGERAFVEKVIVPPLEAEAGVALLQRLGLPEVSITLLRQLHEALGGVPQYLEWVATLLQNPMGFDSWDAIDLDDDDADVIGRPLQEILTRRVQRLLDDPSLTGGPMAIKLKPLLDHILERRLSSDACQVLSQLAVANIPLGKRAVRVLCSRPGLLTELREASLLTASTQRVQVLPMVATALRSRLAVPQRSDLEERLAAALFEWLTKAKTLHEREMGIIVTELAQIYLNQQRFLDAAQLLVRYGWLSFNLGHARRLAALAERRLRQGEWRATADRECGSILLNHFLFPYVGQQVDTRQRAEDYRRILAMARAGNIVLQPHVDVYLVRIMMVYTATTELCFDAALALLDACQARLNSIADVDLQATLLDVYALLFAKWSEYAEEQKDAAQAQNYLARSLAFYRQAATLLSSEEVAQTALQYHIMRKRYARVLTNLAYQLNRAKQYEQALQVLDQSIALKEAGYVEPGSLGPSYGERSQILRVLGRLEEASLFDQRAFEEVQRVAEAGDTTAQEELRIYQVNRALLWIDMGKLEEAEQLLQEAIPNIHERRRRYRMIAQQALAELQKKGVEL